MMSLHNRRAARAAVLAAAVLTPVVAVAAPASAAPQTLQYQCEASAPTGPVNATYTQEVDSSAPATVAPGGALDVVIDPLPNEVPAEAGGFPVRQISDFTLRVPVPANSAHVATSLQGGSGLPSTPQASFDAATNTVVLTLSGAMAGGATFELPTLTISLTAGASGTIDTKLGGTGFADPGLDFTTTVSVLGLNVDAPTACYPDPNPTLSSTIIG
jgi:dehydratase